MELKDIKGIGPKSLEALAKENINTINDLIYMFPKAYYIYEIDNSSLFSEANTCVCGIVATKPYFIKYRANVNACILYVEIGEYKIKCIYFASDYLRYKLFKGMRVMLYGKYKASSNEFVVRKLFLDKIESKVECDYRVDIPASTIKKALFQVFDNNLIIEETLPLELIEKYKLLDIKKYLYLSHFPSSSNDVREVERRRKYEEFFWYSIRLMHLRHLSKDRIKSERLIDDSLINKFIQSLPYTLTSEQERVLAEIRADILSNSPMNRLVQGDVGCGKSIVAIISSLMEIGGGYQAAIMVPTEILANQQYNSAKALLEPFGIRVELFTSAIKKKAAMAILEDLRAGKIDLIIGTHSLIMDRVEFKNLGILIIDEQHRFGVNQRRRLIERYKEVDSLYLSATPIPRSLGLTMFGDLDISSIKALPNGRHPIKTMIIDSHKMAPLFKSIANHIKNGEQCYVVVPLVNMNDTLSRIDINEAYNIFSEGIPSARIGIVHGKLKRDDKALIMDKFKNKELDILIATTVIEVGVSIENATMMVILNSECFGLASLHQLRGRVGRGLLQGYTCLVSEDINNPRLRVLESTTDGFIIAEEDFRLRGPGDYLGSDQSGYMNLDYASFDKDFNIFRCAREDSSSYLIKFLNKEIKNKIFDAIILENEEQNGKIN